MLFLIKKTFLRYEDLKFLKLAKMTDLKTRPCFSAANIIKRHFLFRPTSRLIITMKPIIQHQVLNFPLPNDAASGIILSKTTYNIAPAANANAYGSIV
ncbi:hypothetical protein BpHYR1_041972 [Brachionus plicatilis]|uniref:Uncharacterized protein n=1 Tax=Brachionus plicatilis TaxID=10195 RepID=A0A3M7QDG0_BRAPC|nr:hypothetical protein BpHYR1_041972 [Brachionus plicatilis]